MANYRAQIEYRIEKVIVNIVVIVRKYGYNFLFRVLESSKRADVVYSLEYWPVVHDVAGSIPANLMDGE